MVLPKLWVRKNCMQYHEVCKKEQDAQKGKSCANEMENGKQTQMLCVDSALLSLNWRQFAHK